ncbi:hypothetical protein OZK63_41215, partial [Streptomyces sp. UMAF16]|nr:hypothetical protein [Streptomyces sp. UMAF16]
SDRHAGRLRLMGTNSNNDKKADPAYATKLQEGVERPHGCQVSASDGSYCFGWKAKTKNLK